ncbi:glycoside hydrolase family 9 protein [Arenicella xantha]|uniref:Endoglucanase n=1 Tax=Arenicella xantha TaxID=644221 RepID=A0A395JMD5_9GAMM|nr:glycoside hydrolase family 9 protein [Arenicella xantha]RBP52709.1 non-processive endocellulase [Arenicella xantha]
MKYNLRTLVHRTRWSAVVATGIVLTACGSQSGLNRESQDSLAIQPAAAAPSAPIKVNQIGYSVAARKVAIVPVDDVASAASKFDVVRVTDGVTVFSGDLSAPLFWEFSNETVQQANFSGFREAGSYLVRVAGVGDSYPFEIGDTVLGGVHKGALKSYYLNRSGMPIEAQYAGQHARAAGHPDTAVIVHESAATKARPAGTILSSPKGWYDAGDYGKYIVNSGISTYTLLTAYEHFADFYQTVVLDIPESANQVPDIIDEIKWNLDWMESMQDLDGGVYHKLTLKRFSAMDVQPSDEHGDRYIIGKSVTAALDYAAVMAVASRIMRGFETQFPGLSARYKDNAIRAFQWASDNPTALYQQPDDIKTGEYGDKDASDEFAWAAVELFLLTKDRRYFGEFLKHDVVPSGDLSWPRVAVLAYASLINGAEELLSDQSYAELSGKLIAAADTQVKVFTESAYAVAAEASDFEWGSNSNILNNGFLLLQAYRLTGDTKYRDAAFSTLDYVLGRNATGYSFVTGYGDLTPLNIHHRPSVADATPVPVPGFLAGGPHTGRQDKCPYPGDQPATNYADTVCSYSTNEIAINWNAPLVYLLAAKNDLD